jgi:Tol biopolymer transport system component
VERTGLFAYPSVSPIKEVNTIEISYQVAFLQAITPLESQESNYRLVVMDRDGSNLRILFPLPGEPGLAPIEPAWSPSGDRIAVMYRGDVWIIDVESGIGQPLTADGQAVIYDWSS